MYGIYQMRILFKRKEAIYHYKYWDRPEALKPFITTKATSSGGASSLLG
jgi:hypothetical protein